MSVYTSGAERVIAPFHDSSRNPDFLVVSAESARLAGRAIVAFCESQSLMYLDRFHSNEFAGGLEHFLTKGTKFSDGSRIHSVLTTRSQRLPDNHPAKIHTPDALYEIYARSITGHGDDFQIHEIAYDYEETTDTVRKKTVSKTPEDFRRITRIFEQAAAANPENEAAGMYEATLNELENNAANVELEHQLGVYTTQLVGEQEMSQFQALLTGLAIIDLDY